MRGAQMAIDLSVSYRAPATARAMAEAANRLLGSLNEAQRKGGAVACTYGNVAPVRWATKKNQTKRYAATDKARAVGGAR